MKKVILLICLTSFAAFISMSACYLSYKKRMYDYSLNNFQALTVKSANDIDSIIKKVIFFAEDFAKKITDKRGVNKNILAIFKKSLEKHDAIYGGSVTFRPFFYEKINLYSDYWYKSKNASGKEEMLFVDLDKIYDYTSDSKYNWYSKPMREGKSGWSDTYWDEAGKTYMITYSALFYSQEGESGEKKPAGVVTVDLSLKRLKEIIEAQDLGRNGFGGLTTGDGRYLYHPEQEYVVSGKNLQDIAIEKDDEDRIKVADMARNGQRGIINHVSTTTGEESWLIIEPVPSSGWSIQNTFSKKDIAINTDTLRHQAILMIVLLTAFLNSLISLILLFGFPFKGKVWISIAIFSLIIAAGIGSIWRYALMYGEYKQNGHAVITDEKTLANLVSRLKLTHQERSSDADSSIFFIPTGIYIESIEFSSPNKLSASGYVWQKYPDGFPDDLKKFQIVPFIKIKTEHVWKTKLEDMEIVRTRFEADIPVHISYSKYPLEVEEICIQILSVDNSSVAFVPDFDSNMIDATVRFPGLGKAVSLSGWELTHTLFTLDDRKTDSNFGIATDFDQEKIPVFSYRIGIKRSFINAFISNLIPLIVVAIILFFVLLFPAGVDIDKVLGISTSLSFVVVFSHVGIRKTIVVDELFYLEYFFFVLYGCVVTTPIKSFLIKYGYKGKLVTYRDGIIIKAAYWPVMLSLLFTITALVFY